jgi:hypothetical protein
VVPALERLALWSTKIPAGPLLAGEPRIAIDAIGNSYVTGPFEASIQAGPFTLTSVGEEDVFVVKIDPTGKVVWAAAGGGTKGDRAGDVAPGPAGGAVVTGGFVGKATFAPRKLVAKGYEDLFIWKVSPVPGP